MPTATEALKRPAEDVATEQSPKKARTIDMVALRKQIEYYFSDENLRRDKFFNSKISSNSEGWLDVSLLLSCKKVEAIRATAEDILASIAESDLIISDDRLQIKRSAAVPALVKEIGKPKNEHDGGIMLKVTNIPAEMKWFPIKEALQTQGMKVTYAGNVDHETHECVMLLTPFENDLEKVSALELVIDGAKLDVAILAGDDLKQALKKLPSFIARKRDMRAREAAKSKQKSVELGGYQFPNVAAAKKRVSEILKMRKAGTELKEGSQDYQLILAVLKHHPNAETKLTGMTAIKVDKSQKGDSHCFWVVKGDTCDDISVMKCLAHLETTLQAQE